MASSTYSFSDYAVILDHPSFGQYIAAGGEAEYLSGIGSITISMANDQTAHEIGADGKTLIRKIPSNNGSLIISAQQTSDLHVWLTKLWNYLVTSDASEWAKMNVQINKAPRVGLDGIFASKVSFQKVPDRPFQAQGQHVTWTLMFGEIARFNM